MTALYVHIPFCKLRCSYCDFITYAHIQALQPEYVLKLVQEIETSAFESDPVETVYFGGGTPSLLDLDQVAVILDAVRARFGIAKGAEVTMEVNPGTVQGDYYASLLDLGVNRLSLGVQSFREQDLKVLGRIHSSWQALESFQAARRAGFDNISLDFIFGLPGQDMSGWQSNLEKICVLKPEHLSVYSLILEPGTPLAQWVEKGLVNLPDEDLVADMFEETIAFLGSQGYQHYEISSWALGEEKESHHNKVYWKGQNYLGFGAGAVGNVGGLRWRNTENVGEYLLKISEIARSKDNSSLGFSTKLSHHPDRQRLRCHPAAVETEKLSVEEQMQEMMMLGLRMTREGVSVGAFQKRFGLDCQEVFQTEIKDLISKGLVSWLTLDDGPHLVMTKRGMFLGNRVFQAFV